MTFGSWTVGATVADGKATKGRIFGRGAYFRWGTKAVVDTTAAAADTRSRFAIVTPSACPQLTLSATLGSSFASSALRASDCTLARTAVYLLRHTEAALRASSIGSSLSSTIESSALRASDCTLAHTAVYLLRHTEAFPQCIYCDTIEILQCDYCDTIELRHLSIQQ